MAVFPSASATGGALAPTRRYADQQCFMAKIICQANAALAKAKRLREPATKQAGKHAETRALCAVPLIFASSIDIIFV
jgi:hypothetical protein